MVSFWEGKKHEDLSEYHFLGAALTTHKKLWASVGTSTWGRLVRASAFLSFWFSCHFFTYSSAPSGKMKKCS